MAAPMAKQPAAPPMAKQPAPPPSGPRYYAVYDYAAADDDEISFNEGILFYLLVTSVLCRFMHTDFCQFALYKIEFPIFCTVLFVSYCLWDLLVIIRSHVGAPTPFVS